MEAKEYGNVGKKAIWFVKSLLCGYIVTGFLLLILALMLYKLGLSEQNVNAGIVLIYVISTFSMVLYLGRRERKFLWGLFAGITYFVLLADYFGSIPGVSRECDKYCCDIFAVRRRGNARRNDCLKTVHISIISQSCRAVKKLFKNGAYCAIIL
ncbi:MAG: TIGR04086 family membrane protein [Pilosibacter sp.]